MQLANTPQSYGAVTRTFHWLVALLILAQFPLGLYAEDLPFGTAAELAEKARMFSLHKTLGVAIFLVALLRIAWGVTQPRPAPLHPDRSVETWLAETVHWLLYGSLVLVPLSGWVDHAASSGFAPILWPFGQSLPFVPESEPVAAAAAGLHGVLVWLLAAAIGLHVAGALKHVVLDRDSTLARMWSGRVAALPAAARPSHALPVAAALAIWLAVIGGGLYSGAFKASQAPAPGEALAEVSSAWTVREGTLAITVHQFGSDVTGSFADWTADIAFDPESEGETAGHVDVVVSVGSLTLGSVTTQALGADFLNAAGYPTASFSADIRKASGGYVADGQLTIKDHNAPAVLPFSLDIEGDTATMNGVLTLDRRDFEVGNGLPDEQTLHFPVKVSVSLVAERSGEQP